MKGSKQTQGVCSHPLYFDGLAHYTVPGKLSLDVVPPPRLLLWDLPKALCASKISRCVGFLLAQGSAGGGHTAKRGAVFSECFFWCCIQCRSL